MPSHVTAESARPPSRKCLLRAQHPEEWIMPPPPGPPSAILRRPFALYPPSTSSTASLPHWLAWRACTYWSFRIPCTRICRRCVRVYTRTNCIGVWMGGFPHPLISCGYFSIEWGIFGLSRAKRGTFVWVPYWAIICSHSTRLLG